MATQTIAGERHKHSREGVLARLENVAYTVLRKYGIYANATQVARCAGAVTIGSPRSKGVRQELIESDQRKVASSFPRTQASQNPTTHQVNKEDTNMSTNLVVVVSNAQPNRDHRYPAIWLLYSQGQDPLAVHVGHDSHRRPHVLGKGAA